MVAEFEQRESLPERIDRRWLYDESCRPPCWEGLVAGETPLWDAMAILEANPEILDYGVTDNHYIMYWEAPSLLGNAVLSNDESGRIEEISIEILGAEMVVSDVTNLLGDPHYVVPVIVTGIDTAWVGVFFYLVYPKMGFALSGEWVKREPGSRGFDSRYVTALYYSRSGSTLDDYLATVNGGPLSVRRRYIPFEPNKSFYDYCIEAYGPSSELGQLCPQLP
ncbi:MAG: hypothetical protein KDD73_11830 [Anaerolineales bacterium]|nr:hypothetical protein [Anaerolineales bacterium]MCB9129224.1 hypothetical protein [Ardenticatenales bacterium]